MNFESTLTVIIPHLNAPEALAQCLAALSAQRRADNPFDIIVVDNGSRSLPRSECAAYPFVQLTEEPEPGPGPARNHGARLARTEILAFIDCDCIAAPGWIDAITSYMAAHPETGAIGGDVRIAFVDAARPTAIEAYESVFGYRMKLYIERYNFTGTGNLAVRRDVFEKVGPFAGIGVAEDIDWGRRATALGVQIDYVEKMRISTPARTDFAELRRKWDRHIGHDFERVEGFFGRVLWTIKALALAGSPPIEALRIARSDRVCGLRTRAAALLCLSRIRLYRTWRMLGFLIGRGPTSAGAWRNDRRTEGQP